MMKKTKLVMMKKIKKVTKIKMMKMMLNNQVNPKKEAVEVTVTGKVERIVVEEAREDWHFVFDISYKPEACFWLLGALEEIGNS